MSDKIIIPKYFVNFLEVKFFFCIFKNEYYFNIVPT